MNRFVRGTSMAYSTTTNTAVNHSHQDIVNSSVGLGLIYMTTMGIYVYYMTENNINFLYKEQRKMEDSIQKLQERLTKLENDSTLDDSRH